MEQGESTLKPGLFKKGFHENSTPRINQRSVDHMSKRKKVGDAEKYAPRVLSSWLGAEPATEKACLEEF